MSIERLTPTSYLVLGLLAREGAATPYRVERLVAATLGNFWSFPHTLLYSEPSRLEALGLVTETREAEGRRRRIFAITPAGIEALTAWLMRPVEGPVELRDLGLLQLFFMDLASDEARLRLAEAQLATHGARLSAYEEDARIERGGRASRAGSRTVEHWRGATLPMGLLYERAAVAFWAEVARDAAGRMAADGSNRPSAGDPPRRGRTPAGPSRRGPGRKATASAGIVDRPSPESRT
jgi:DNA-binding PadR family transcriptional regulator